MPAVVGRAFDENQAGFFETGGLVEFDMGRREALPVLLAVFIAEKTEIKIALVDFVKIDGIGTTVRSGYIALEKKGFIMTRQHPVASKVFSQAFALPGKFFLRAADEDSLFHVSMPNRARTFFSAALLRRASASATFNSATISATGR